MAATHVSSNSPPAATHARAMDENVIVTTSDLALRGRIIEALADAPDVGVAEIAVECHDDGDVVLRGSVVNVLQRAEAVRTARGVPGVHAVDDQMRTRPVGVEHRTAAETEAAVLDALILDDAVPAYG